MKSKRGLKMSSILRGNTLKVGSVYCVLVCGSVLPPTCQQCYWQIKTRIAVRCFESKRFPSRDKSFANDLEFFHLVGGFCICGYEEESERNENACG